ncbi:hypothetical protein [Streptomyces halobius]|uniref:Uncharacterized protein n=1 Tax=Streptomyces halobius TaxID=2879846 RepID=A0ABY4M0H2_9ACTN|nr:hypothetical protein [Streptomyces halobius]UQA91251.1 hypothetical protein K9S39_04600 [Streptomyces halobius]
MAYVYSPDKTLRHPDYNFALCPQKQTEGAVIEWLEQRADAWIKGDVEPVK